MPVVAVTATNSVQKQPKYLQHRRLYAVDDGALPGLHTEIRQISYSILTAIKKLFGKPTGQVMIGGGVASFSTTQIVTEIGYLLDADGVYYLENFPTLTPNAASYWGFFELELVQEDSDDAALDFWEPTTDTPFTDVGSTKVSYKVKVYDNYSTTAAFPTLTPGRIRWIDYKRASAGGNILSATLVNVPLFQLDSTGNALVSKDPDTAMALVTKQYVDSLTGLRGITIGGIRKDSNNPAAILAGCYDVKGKIVNVMADLTGTFLNECIGHNAVENDCWYLSLLNNLGQMKTHLAYGDQVLPATAIQGITSAGGGQFNILVLNAVNIASVPVGGIAVVKNSLTGNGPIVITAVDNASDSGGVGYKYIRARNSNMAAVGAGGTIAVHHRIANTDTVGSVETYSPLLDLDATYNQFLSPYDSSYRVLGYYRADGSGLTVDTTSFGSGDRTNDDWIRLQTFSGRVNDTIRYVSAYRLRGKNLSWTDDGTNGSRINVLADGFIVAAAGAYSGGANQVVYITKNNGTTLTINSTKVLGQGWVASGNPGGAATKLVPVGFGDYICAQDQANENAGTDYSWLDVMFIKSGGL